jgi:hypothetical protein
VGLVGDDVFIAAFATANYSGGFAPFPKESHYPFMLVLWSNVIGGAGPDAVLGLCIDRNDSSILVSGFTTSQNFQPIVNPLQATLRGLTDGFLVQLNKEGMDRRICSHYQLTENLGETLCSTFIGGESQDATSTQCHPINCSRSQ